MCGKKLEVRSGDLLLSVNKQYMTSVITYYFLNSNLYKKITHDLFRYSYLFFPYYLLIGRIPVVHYYIRHKVITLWG